MGYTLYFDYAAQPMVSELSNFKREAKKVLKAFGVESVNIKPAQEDNLKLNNLIETKADNIFKNYKEKQPIKECCFAVFYLDKFVLYGPHESLSFEASDGMHMSDFCKTARKSYDILCKILALLAEKYLPIKFVYHDGEDCDFLIYAMYQACQKDMQIAADIIDSLGLAKEGMFKPSDQIALDKAKPEIIKHLKRQMGIEV
jgi:hypothetical protein